MNKQEAIKQYNEYMKLTKIYEYAVNSIYFDDVTGASKKSFKERNDVMQYFNFELYKRNNSEEFIKIINNLDKYYNSLNEKYKRILDITKKQLENNKKVPLNEVDQYQRDCSNAFYYWQIAKSKNDYSIYKPYLKKVMEGNVKFSSYYELIDNNNYNSFLDMSEEGQTVRNLDEFFDVLKKRIIPLLEKIKNSDVKINDSFTKRKISKDKQLKMAEYVSKVIGYDLSRGMIRETEHPFTEEISINDVRITTHIYENCFLSNLYSVIHEGGHGIYMQNINKRLKGTILRDGASMAFHESQSRFYENVIGRSEEFCNLIFPQIQKIAGGTLNDVTSKDFYLSVNKVEPSLIRTEADELTYCLHIIIRYEIEKMIMANEVDYDKLNEIWNQKYMEYLHIMPDGDKNGILQDVHWTSGVGYFVSYAVGNAYAQQIYHTMKKDIDVEKIIESGDLTPIKKWLTKNMYCYGKLLTPNDLIIKVTGEKLNPNYYCDYLEEKYSKIYHLK